MCGQGFFINPAGGVTDAQQVAEQFFGGIVQAAREIVVNFRVDHRSGFPEDCFRPPEHRQFRPFDIALDKVDVLYAIRADKVVEAPGRDRFANEIASLLRAEMRQSRPQPALLLYRDKQVGCTCMVRQGRPVSCDVPQASRHRFQDAIVVWQWLKGMNGTA